MCVTHIYTDCYPKRTVEFHQTIVCPNAKDGISCAAHITNEHPPRTLESNDDLSSKEYLDQGLKVPLTPRPSPHQSTTTSTYRYSPGDKKDRSPGREPRLRLVRKNSALVSALTPRRKHPKERIVIVNAPDSPEGSKTLSKYAPDSPATEEFYSKNLLVDDRSTPRRSPNGSLNPVRTVIVEHHRDHSKERERPLKELPIILAPEPPSRSPSREKALVDMRILREQEERERERQREYEREQAKSFELVHEARRELERERVRKAKIEDERSREAEYQKFLRDRELEREKERNNDIERKRARDMEEELLRERERARSSDRKREEESARERERRRRDDELRRADEHERERREDQHRREREREKALDDKEREERMRKAEKSERKAADDARRLAEQVKAFAKEDEEIRRRPSVPGREKEMEREIDRRADAARWKKEDDDMYARLRERQARDDGHASGLGRGASFSGRGDGDREVLDRLKERQKGPEEGYMPKRRTTIGGGSGRRRGDERIIWDDGEGGRGGRW
ncbi:uncharacterized protein Bfra_007756 [Botrytis fragariae]|uniref:Uncharacterized protein n=1 Tax=Botrytis fragariae TaxID=1964551 RepID=A0A8H6AP62_9HELO|nr:uncharacterized protein Bfra_007756 [Botrytis fragariae]KAF5871241.1 hypothetical protein Bfra_007756 [Botrytis fragariae]